MHPGSGLCNYSDAVVANLQAQRPRIESMPDRISSKRRRGILRTRSVRTCLSNAVTSDTFATESCGKPVSSLRSRTGIGPFEIAREGDADYSRNFASVDRVTLCHNDRPPPVAGFRVGRFFEISPPDLSLLNYHSTRRITRRPAR